MRFCVSSQMGHKLNNLKQICEIQIVFSVQGLRRGQAVTLAVLLVGPADLTSFSNWPVHHSSY